jgi:signal transduction histidine kinase
MASSATSPARIAPRASVLLRAGWLLIQCGGLAVAAAATPALAETYRTTCASPLCDLIAQPNAHTVALLHQANLRLEAYAGVMVGLDWLWLLAWIGLGGLIVWKRPSDPVGLPVAYGGTVVGVAPFLTALAATDPDLVVPGRLATAVAGVALPLFLALFPDGRFVPSWCRWVTAAAVPAGLLQDAAGPLGTAAQVLLPPLLAVLLGAQVYRYRQVSTTAQRQQMKWLLLGTGLYVGNLTIAGLLYLLGVAERYQLLLLPVCYGASFAVVAAVGFSVLRYRLFDVDVVVNRALVYGILSAGVVGFYAAVVGGLGALFPGTSTGLGFLAAAVVAVAFQPVRMRLQRGVNRLVYGVRDEPYELLTRLGHQLEASLSSDAVLATLTETVAAALKVPYAAIALGGETAAEVGVRGQAALLEVPLVYQGEPVGELRVEPRSGERALTAKDQRLLEDLASHAGSAGHAVRVTRELQRAREQLVTAREEERRRLRRDLHDGLGPTLASQALIIDTAGLVLDSDRGRAVDLLRQATAQSHAAIDEVRRVTHELRPPALDDLGLADALREAAAVFTGGGLLTSIVAPDPLPSLPAAVEVAAYRIAQEALTNVARHAHATRCRIDLRVAEAVELTVTDDGVGLDGGRRAGVGLASMRERAEELGGTLRITADGRGTIVVARLPLGP